jgi:hypothetical protein
MALERGVVILNVQDGQAFDQKGRPVRYRIVAYTVDGLGPFGLDGPADELTTEEIRRRIALEAHNIRQLMGGEL